MAYCLGSNLKWGFTCALRIRKADFAVVAIRGSAILDWGDKA